MALTINRPKFGNIFVTADTFSDLRSVPSTSIEAGYSAICNGALAPGDLTGGLYVWIATSTDADDNYDTLAPSDGSTGRWKRSGSQGPTGPQGEGLADVEAPGGAALVGYLGRTVAAKLGDYPSVKDFGALGDGLADDTAALQAAITGTTGEVRFPVGNYATSSTLTIAKPLNLIGSGAASTAINPAKATAADNAITLIGTTSNEYTTLEKLFVGDIATGTRVGANGIVLLTSATGQFFSKTQIRNVSVGTGTGWAIEHYNTSPDPQGGMYCATFENNTLRGGVCLYQSGDSNNILYNIITGPNIGVNAFPINGAGNLQIIANNITCNGGALRITGGSNTRVIGNNCENTLPGAAAQNNAAVFYFNGTNETIVGGEISANRISAFGTTDATTLLYLQNCRGTYIHENEFLPGVAGVTTDIYIDNTCIGVIIGSNATNRTNGIIPTLVIVDNGVGTIGLSKALTLANGWLEHGAGQGLRFIKSNDGSVRLNGRIISGTATDGVSLGILPSGFRPSVLEFAPATYVTPTGYTVGQVAIDIDGNITAYGIANATDITLDMQFTAAALANTLSPG